MTKQPEWEFVANLGDAAPVYHDGYFIFRDKTGVYAPEAELIEPPPEDSEGLVWKVYRITLEPCTYINGILSDDKYHPDSPAWFQDDLKRMADFWGIAESEAIRCFCSDDPIKRAEAYRMVGEYYGWDELDYYPFEFSETEIIEKLDNHHAIALVMPLNT